MLKKSDISQKVIINYPAVSRRSCRKSPIGTSIKIVGYEFQYSKSDDLHRPI